MIRRRRLACSFCGKDEAHVDKLVAGPKVYICDRCVAAASRIMEQAGGEPPVAVPRPGGLRSMFGRIRQGWQSAGGRPLKRHAVAD